MDPKKKTPAAPSTTTPPTNVTTQPTDDVLVDTPISEVTVDDGTVDAAAAGAQALPSQSLKDAFNGGATAVSDNIEGGSPWMPKDPAAFSRGFQIIMGVVSLFVGFRTFMTAVKRPQAAVLVPPAATAVSQYWGLLQRLVPGAIADINIVTIRALLARLLFVQTLSKYSSTLNSRLLAVQSHLEDQLATQMRPLYDRCETLFTTHDDLMDPMEPVIDLYGGTAQKAANARRNNQKVGEAAVAKDHAKTAPAPTEGIPSVPGGTTATPATPVPPATPVAVAPPVKAAPQAPPARKKTRGRG